MRKAAALVLAIVGPMACHSAPLDAPETNEGGAAGAESARTTSEPLVANDGWIEEGSNHAGVHGAVFVHGDSTTSETLSSNISGTRWCMSGAAAQIDVKCQPVPPARDCFDMRSGAVLSMNLNQERGGDADAYDPVGITGFAFDLSGADVPPFLSFNVSANDSATYCKHGSISMTDYQSPAAGHREVMLSELINASCNKSHAAGPDLPSVGAKLVTLNWRISGSTSAAAPFDFCVEDFRLLTE